MARKVGKVKMFYDKDAKMSALKGKTVAILGYGSQGHAHAQNLRDSGVKVIVAERPGTDNFKLALKHGFKPMTAGEAVRGADLIVFTCRTRWPRTSTARRSPRTCGPGRRWASRTGSTSTTRRSCRPGAWT